MTIHNSRAFTLLELMATLSIVALLLTLGVPAFQDYALKQAMTAAVNALHSDLLIARSQAVFEDMSVIACPGIPAGGCTGSTGWDDGWIVFGDLNEDRNYQADEPLLRQGEATGNMVIHSTSGRTDIRFYPNGSAPGSNVSISFCGPAGPETARKLVISNLGRIRRDTVQNLDQAYCPSADIGS